MRQKVRVFYYPDFQASFVALGKAALLFDEIHFMDRPSFTFHRGGTVGLIGAASPMRRFEKSFQEAGVPVYVHPAPEGPVTGELMTRIEADISDQVFLLEFQKGLSSSERFRDLQIAPGNYGQGRTNLSISEQLVGLDLQKVTNPVEYLDRVDIHPFDTSTEDARVRFLITEAMFLSAKMNFALHVDAEYGFSPFADAPPFQRLLSVKYRRAMKNVAEGLGLPVSMTDICSALIDELFPPEVWKNVNVRELVEYRNASEIPREGFLESLSGLEEVVGKVDPNADYSQVVGDIITRELLPAAKTFRNKLRTIHEKLFGTVAKDILTAAGGMAAVQVFGDLSWTTLARIGGLFGAAIGRAAIEALITKRGARRDCAISYLLDSPLSGAE